MDWLRNLWDFVRGFVTADDGTLGTALLVVVVSATLGVAANGGLRTRRTKRAADLQVVLQGIPAESGWDEQRDLLERRLRADVAKIGLAESDPTTRRVVFLLAGVALGLAAGAVLVIVLGPGVLVGVAGTTFLISFQTASSRLAPLLARGLVEFIDRSGAAIGKVVRSIADTVEKFAQMILAILGYLVGSRRR